MVSRLLSSVAVLLALGITVAQPARAQNLEAGKSSAQIFTSTCSVCHKSPRGLLRTVPPNAVGSFLRQHYTTSAEMASALGAYLVSNGATDARGRQDGPAEPKQRRQRRGAPEAVAPDEAAPAPQAEEPKVQRGRKSKRRAARSRKPSRPRSAATRSGCARSRLSPKPPSPKPPSRRPLRLSPTRARLALIRSMELASLLRRPRPKLPHAPIRCLP